MKDKAYILLGFILLGILCMDPAAAAYPKRNRKQNREWQLKAAFVYSFINFVEWPKEKMSDNNDPITIGIVGNKELVKAFAPVENKRIRRKRIIIRCFEDIEEPKPSKVRNSATRKRTVEALKKCHIAILCPRVSASTDNCAAIINALKGSPVLTVSERAGFLESGGNIRVFAEKKRIRFEINLVSARRNRLSIRSKLLKLATRVVKRDTSKGRKGNSKGTKKATKPATKKSKRAKD
ncbi:MAG: YfiR family protein [Planctomycetes bacterium]|nr:YfiR family protein [Planctomycetota bacterium]